MISKQILITFSAVFCYYFISLYSFLDIPPIWDATAGAFAPAIYLYEHNLDYSALSTLAGYQNAGPNVHSYSSITLLTLLVMKLCNGDVDIFLPVLHLLNFIMGALVVTLCFSTLYRLYNLRTALFAALLIMLCPLYSVQVSYVYAEIAGSLCAVAALTAWVFKRHWLAVILVILACSIKSLGLFIAAGIGFLLVLDMLRRGPRWGIPKLSILILSVFTIEFLKIILIARSGQAGVSYDQHINKILGYLDQAPDLYIWPILFYFSFTWLIFRFRPYSLDGLKTILNSALEDCRERFLIGAAVLITAFIGFILTIYMSGYKFFPLLRYYVWVLPLFISLGIIFLNELPLLATRYFRHGSGTYNVFNTYSVWIIVFLILTFFAFNRDGKLYPHHGTGITSFSVVERSFEYLDFYKLQRAAVKLVADRYPDNVVYVTRGEYYFLSSPLMGYVDHKPSDVRFILASRSVSSDLSTYPDEFLVLDTNSTSYHGQFLLEKLVSLADKDKRYTTKVLENINIGPYSASLIKIQKIK